MATQLFMDNAERMIADDLWDDYMEGRVSACSRVCVCVCVCECVCCHKVSERTVMLLRADTFNVVLSGEVEANL